MCAHSYHLVSILLLVLDNCKLYKYIFLHQADLDMPDLLDTPLDSPDTDMEVISSGAISRQYSHDATTSTVSIQGSGNHYHACASDDYEDVGFDPSILPPPDPWIDSVTEDPLDVNFSSSALLEVRGRLFSDIDLQCSRL